MMPALVQTITPDHVARARRLMRQGWGLREVAEHLKVSTYDLDIALWQFIAWHP